MTAWASAQSRCRRRRVARWPPQQSETEVQNLQTSIGRHSKIPRLQVSVDHTLHVSRGKTFRELERETHRFLLLQRSGGQHVFDGCPRDELHHQKIHVIEGVEVVDGGDVGVIELGEGTSLPRGAASGISHPRPALRSIPSERRRGPAARRGHGKPRPCLRSLPLRECDSGRASDPTWLRTPPARSLNRVASVC